MAPKMGVLGYFGGTESGTSGARIKILTPLFNTNNPQKKHSDTLDPGKVIFGHFIDFGHFPIEIPIEAEKFYGQQKEGSYIKNKNCFENQRPNGTI